MTSAHTQIEKAEPHHVAVAVSLVVSKDLAGLPVLVTTHTWGLAFECFGGLPYQWHQQ